MVEATGPLASGYFITLVALGSFYTLNLFLAVLWDTYCEQQDAEKAEKAEAEAAEAERLAERDRALVELERVERIAAEHRAAAEEAARAEREAAAVGSDPKRKQISPHDRTRRLGFEDDAEASLLQGYAPSEYSMDETPPRKPSRRHMRRPESKKIARRMRMVNGVEVPAADGCCLYAVQALVDSPSFQSFIVLLILLNTVAMMLEQYPMDVTLLTQLSDLNLLLTLAFTAEMVLKLLADGCAGYFGDAFNRFDAVVVTLSLIDLAIVYYDIDLGVNVSVLRAMRLMRVFKLARSWATLRRVMEGILSSIGQLANLFLLMLLLIFVFALFGMHVFGGAFTPEVGFDEPPRTNFDTIGDAMLTVFVVVSGENWNDVWSSSAAAVGYWCAPYFVLLVITGNYVVLNLFVAILLGGFTTDIEEVGVPMSAPAAAPAAAPSVDDPDDVALYLFPPSHPARRMAKATIELQFSIDDHEDSDVVGIHWRRLGREPPPGAHVLLSPRLARELVQGKLAFSREDLENADKKSDGPLTSESVIKGGEYYFAPVTDKALLEENQRRAAHSGVGGLFSFEGAIVMWIVISCVAMTFESCTLDPSSELAINLEKINLLATAVFTVELVLKVLAFGLLFTPNAYLKSGWHQLDATIVAASLLSLLAEDDGNLSTLRLLRVLRPLRLIAKFGNLRVVVDLLIKTIPACVNVMLVVGLFSVVFGILGVQLFAGTFASCRQIKLSEAGEVVAIDAASERLCVRAGGLWTNPALGSFDNIGASMLLLFESSTMEGWPDVMYYTIDATAPGRAPERNTSRAQGLFMVAWTVVGGMFLTNVFVGVIVDQFAYIKKVDDGLLMISEEQQEWVDSMANLLSLKPSRYPPEPKTDRIRARVYRVVSHKRFELVVFGVILFNTGLLGLDGFGDSPEMLARLQFGNLVCTLLFGLEAAAKIYALEAGEYFRDPWNVFDFFVVSVSLLDIIEFIGASIGFNPSLLRALRTARVLRIIRTVKSAKGLRVLLTTLLLSLPALANIGAIFFILLTLFSILGMRLFGHIAYGNYLNHNANFCNFPTAMLTMLRCSTGESWNGLMHDAMIMPGLVYSDVDVQHCSPDEGNCGNPLASMLFFIAFQISASFIILNMMIALILEEYGKEVGRGKHRVSAEHAELFVEAWQQFDPYATGRMHVRHLHALIRKLPPPLGLDPKKFSFSIVKDTDVSNYISKLKDIKSYVNEETGAPEVSFNELLQACTKAAFSAVAEAVDGLPMEAKIVKELQEQMKSTLEQGLDPRTIANNNLIELTAVCTIQRRWFASNPGRRQRNAKAKKEAIRLRTPGTLVPSTFAGRVQHSTVNWGGRLFVFGGRAEGRMLRDFWEFSFNAGYWVDQSHTVPERMRPRCGHTAMITGTSRMLIVGGHDGERFLADVWECELNGLYWRQVGFSAGELPGKISRSEILTRQPSSEVEGGVPIIEASSKLDSVLDRPSRMQLAAIITIQAHARGRQARVAAAWRNALADLEFDAATYVQAIWRGFLVRALKGGGAQHSRLGSSPRRFRSRGLLRPVPPPVATGSPLVRGGAMRD